MERKIGEIFKLGGEWYQCISDTTDDNCNNCFFKRAVVTLQVIVAQLQEATVKAYVSRNLKRSESLMNLMGIYFNHTIHLKCLYSQKIMRLLEN